ncbi:MAG: substrate-binding domain-containing protein [Kiritimatiellae bacterium]|nr:substrate-binding domain-containing protein [Kiritimatiellia bacterium]
MRKRDKNVLVFLTRGGEFELRVFLGVQDAAEARHWNLSAVECIRDADGSLRFIRSPGGVTLGEIFKYARPDGVIVVGNAIRPEELPDSWRRMPVVFVDRPACWPQAGQPKPVCVYSDAASYARIAAQELFRSGFCDYAYLPWSGEQAWSGERGKCFGELVTSAGFAFHGFVPPSSGPAADPVAYLSPFMESLPKPCGIFAANDVQGEAALRICAAHGWSVPQDVAVVGVDNLEFICEATSPTLSSVCRFLEGDGRTAAALLSRWMNSPERRPASRATPALHVVRRASTFFSTDRRIARAMEFIRLHACDEGFAPSRVMREIGLGRTQTAHLFRKVQGCSVLDAIHEVRLARAQTLLRAGKSASYVADTCGFASLVDFRRVFKRHTGQTVRKWALAACATG